MTKHPTRTRIPRYTNVVPEGLATADQLRAVGLKPGTTTPVALLEYSHGDRSGVCGLFERSAAVPAPEDTAGRTEPSVQG